MRALDTLQMAASPLTSPSGRADPQPRTATRTREEKLGFLHTDFAFQPRVNPAVPDYEALYKAFQRRAAKGRDTREVTRNKPFLLRTASLCRTRRSCNAVATGGREVRAQAVAKGCRGLDSDAQNPRRPTSQSIFLHFSLKHQFRCNQICRPTIPINLRPQKYFFYFLLSREVAKISSSRSGRQGVGINC